MRCVKVVCAVERFQLELLEAIQWKARTHAIEGCVIYQQPHTIQIIACGQGDSVETFIDFVHMTVPPYEGHEVAIDPFLKDKDYRGVFRIIA